jgi:ribosomal protein L7/L12
MNFTTLSKYYLESQHNEALLLIFEKVKEMGAAKKFYEEFKKRIEQIKIPQSSFLKVIECLEKNQKIHAVKVLVDETGLGLKESKNLIDGIEDFLRGNTLSTNPSENSSSQDQIEQEVKQLLAQNRKIEAVKYVKETTGLGLKESKDYVDKFG